MLLIALLTAPEHLIIEKTKAKTKQTQKHSHNTQWALSSQGNELGPTSQLSPITVKKATNRSSYSTREHCCKLKGPRSQDDEDKITRTQVNGLFLPKGENWGRSPSYPPKPSKMLLTALLTVPESTKLKGPKSQDDKDRALCLIARTKP